jgi:hypothetical protein
MELAQAGHHFFRGTYLAYLAQVRAAPLIFLMAPFDRLVRQAAKNWFSAVLQNPSRLFDGVRIQTIGIIQAPDVQPNGQADMCDSCPDMTVWNGTLINSCRMDEYRLFGGMLSVADKARVTAISGTEAVAPDPVSESEPQAVMAEPGD